MSLLVSFQISLGIKPNVANITCKCFGFASRMPKFWIGNFLERKHFTTFLIAVMKNCRIFYTVLHLICFNKYFLPLCFLKLFLWLQEYPHRSHTYGFSPVCVLKCMINRVFSPNFFSHWSHSNLLLWTVFLCLFRSRLVANRSSHRSQENTLKIHNNEWPCKQQGSVKWGIQWYLYKKYKTDGIYVGARNTENLDPEQTKFLHFKSSRKLDSLPTNIKSAISI